MLVLSLGPEWTSTRSMGHDRSHLSPMLGALKVEKAVERSPINLWKGLVLGLERS